MAIQTFVADTILTAAQMNALQANDYNQTVSNKVASYTLVAADAGTKVVMNSASATTITVNTSLFSAGDTLTILNIAAGVTTVTAGTATVSSAGSLALSQYASGTLYFTSAGVSVFEANGVAASASGLTLINATTAGTTVGSVAISNVFSATYDAYLVSISGGVSSNATMGFNIILGATVTGYYYAFGTVNYSGSIGTPDTAANAANIPIGYGSSTGAGVSCDIFNPFLAKKSVFLPKALTLPSTTGYTEAGGGFLNDTTSYTGFTITPSVGTITGHIIRTYGYQNS